MEPDIARAASESADMGKIYGLDGKEITSVDAPTEAPHGRIQPYVDLDAPDGRFRIPVVILAAVQYDQLKKELTEAVLDAVLAVPRA